MIGWCCPICGIDDLADEAADGWVCGNRHFIPRATVEPVLLASPTLTEPVSGPAINGHARRGYGDSLLRTRLSFLERENARLKCLNNEVEEERSAIMEVLRNKGIKTERAVALAVVFFVSSELSRSRDEDGFCRVPLGAIADNAGCSAQRAGVHLSRLHEFGILERQLRQVVKQVLNRETGESTFRVHNEVWVRLQRSQLQTLKALARLCPERLEGAGWGGKRRPRCPDHPDAGIVERLHCAICDRLLGQSSAQWNDEDSEPVDSLSLQDEAIEYQYPLSLQDEAIGVVDVSPVSEDAVASRIMPRRSPGDQRGHDDGDMR